MTRIPPKPLANKYMRIPMMSIINHLFENSRAGILMKPLLTNAINENRIPKIPVISGSRKAYVGRIPRPIPKIIKIPSMSPTIPPSNTSNSPIFFRSDNLTISPCYGVPLKKGLLHNSKTTIYNMRKDCSLLHNQLNCSIFGETHVNS